MKLKAFIAITGAFAMTFANAGDAKAPIVIEDDLGATISTGYETSYIFRGEIRGDNAIWTGLDYTLTALPVDVDLGVYYVNPTDSRNQGNDDELHISAAVAGPSFAGFDSAVSVTAFLYPEAGADETYEVALGVSRSLGIVDIYASVHYDFEIEAWYAEAGAEKAFGISDNMDLVIASGVSYQDDYHTSGSDFNHAYVSASLPISLRSNVTLTPYVAGLFALDALENAQDDEVHGGVSISVNF
jgi:hypothetical protein